MNKLRFLTALIVIVSLILSAAAQLSAAQSSTQVGGLINSDITWTKTNSPYTLTSPVIVSYGTILTIEPGATINLNGYNLQVNGVLYARGTNTNNIVFASSSGGTVSFTASSASWNEKTGEGCIVEDAVLNGVYVSVHTSSPKLSNNTMYPSSIGSDGMAVSMESGAPLIIGNYINGSVECLDGASPTIINNSFVHGGISGEGFDISAPVIVNNTICGGTAQMVAGTGIYADGANYYIANNTIFGCVTAVSFSDGTNIIEGNLIINNTNGITISGSSSVSVTLRHNTICNNSVGILNYGSIGSFTFAYNNIVSNTKYTLQGLNVTYNWWGTSDQQVITQALSSSATFVPFLTAPDASAPAIPANLNQPPTPSASPSPSPSPTPSPHPSSTPTITPSQAPYYTPANATVSPFAPSANPTQTTQASSSDPTATQPAVVSAPETPEFSSIIVLTTLAVSLAIVFVVATKRKKHPLTN